MGIHPHPAIRDRRPLLVAAVFALLLTSGVAAWPAAHAAACPSVLVASSNEKFELMQQLAQDYSKTHPNLWSGCGDVVSVEQVASGAAEHLLESGWSGPDRPDVWSPAAYSWALLLRATRPRLLPAAQPPSIATSPLVVAMPEPMAQAMGWPAVQPTWRDLLLLAQDKQGWGRFGHSEWGMFRLGKTDPRLSTSGLHSMIATYYAATQKSADLTLGDVNAGSSSSFVQGIEASVTHYAPTIDSFLDNLAGLDSLDYISAVPAEEQEVLQYNEGLHSPESPREPPRIPLAAIYPGGSTLVADHPYIVLNWVTDSAKKRIAAGFLSWLQEPPQQERFAAAGFRDDRHNATGLLTHEVGILAAQPASVLDPPRDPAVVAAIEATWTQTRKRAQVLVVLALANSAQRTSVERGLGQLTRNDEVAVWGVSAGAPVQRGSMEPLPAADDAVLHAINSAPVGTRRVALYQAVDDAYRYLAEHADPERINAVIVISAVRDDGSGTTLTQVERTLRAPSSAPPVRVYTVALDGSDATALLGIQKASGGVAASGDAASAIRTALANF